MHMEINDNTALREIQLVFSNFYPYLELQFYRKAHSTYEVSAEKDAIEPDTTVGAIKKTHVSGLLEIQPLYKVSDVEKEFQERFGLSIQVFRKENEEWVQAAGMDDFTLKDLNEIGRSSSDDFIISEYEEGFAEPEEKPEKLF